MPAGIFEKLLNQTVTTYAFHLTLRETDMRVMEEALDLYIKHCQDKIDTDGSESVFRKLDAAREVKSSLYSNMEQTSGNNFFEHEG